MSKLRTALNSALRALDEKRVLNNESEEGELEVACAHTAAVGLKRTSPGAYLVEFDSADSANRFCYAATD